MNMTICYQKNISTFIEEKSIHSNNDILFYLVNRSSSFKTS